MKLSIVIPAYNEEKRVEAVLEKYLAAFPSGEIILVSNGSTDHTVSIANSFKKKFSNLKISDFKEKLGKGGAIKEGFRAAKGGLISFVDCDLSTHPSEFLKLVRAMSGQADAAIASRRIPGAKIVGRQPILRTIAGKIFNILVRTVVGLSYIDTQCGAKIFTRNFVEQILPLVQSTGFVFDVELLLRAKQKGMRVLEVPITWHHEAHSTFSLRHNIFPMFVSLFRMRLS